MTAKQTDRINSVLDELMHLARIADYSEVTDLELCAGMYARAVIDAVCFEIGSDAFSADSAGVDECLRRLSSADCDDERFVLMLTALQDSTEPSVGREVVKALETRALPADSILAMAVERQRARYGLPFGMEALAGVDVKALSGTSLALWADIAEWLDIPTDDISGCNECNPLLQAVALSVKAFAILDTIPSAA